MRRGGFKGRGASGDLASPWLHGASRVVPPEHAQPGTASLFIANPFEGLQRVSRCSSTHPSVEERVARLRALVWQRRAVRSTDPGPRRTLPAAPEIFPPHASTYSRILVLAALCRPRRRRMRGSCAGAMPRACLSPLPLLLLLASCALHADAAGPAASAAPIADDGARATPCAAPPAAEVGRYRHGKNRLLRSLGGPRFRGVDLIAAEDDPIQTLGGKLAYTAADSDVSDEDVDVYACFPHGWRLLSRARTGGDGRFEVALAGGDRLPPGMRDLYAHVPGDGGGARFLAYVAPRGAQAIACDVDGTLTESEDAILSTVLFGDDVGHQPHAPRALAAAAAAGQPIVYVTSRGDQYTEVTRRWLARHAFPPGPLRLARAAITQPGPRTVAFKTAALRALGIPLAAGIGNRSSDVAAYAGAGLPPARILVRAAEFADELRPALAAGRATAFRDYREIPALLGRAAP